MTDPSEFKIAVICSSNQNRSMEAHNFLKYEVLLIILKLMEEMHASISIYTC